MKVMMVPHLLNLNGEGGINTIVRKYFAHAPSVGIEFVAPNASSFDVLAVHAGMTKEFAAPLVSHLHGLYWSADYQSDPWQYKANRDVIASIRYANVVTVPMSWVAEPLQRDLHLDPIVLPHGVDWQEWQHKEPNEGYILWNKNRNYDVCSPVAVGELAKRFPAQNFISTFAPKGDHTNVKVSGVLPYDQMRTAVQRCSVYLATIKETFGVGTLEAMAAGKPILGFRHGGTAQLVKHGANGYLAEPGNYEDLARGLAYCIANSSVLGDNSRMMARRYGWEQVVEQLYDVYKLAQDSMVAPSTTVVIPCFQYGHVLERAVRSALAQDCQIVIVNNNSTDNTEQVAKALEDEYPTRIRHVNCPQQGVAYARNFGIALAKSKYICCLDADDEIKPGFLEVCVKTLEADPALGLAYTRLEWVQPDGQRGISQWPGEYNYDSFLKGQNQCPTCCVFRRSLWQRLGGYRQRYAPEGAGAEDADFWFRIGAAGFLGKLATNEALFVYHLGGRVSGNPAYHEVDWRKWHPWVRDNKHPFASVATSRNGMSHAVRQYDEPQISVVIPCSPAHQQYLVDALDSLEAQTFRQWEVIVVCDGFEPDEALQTAYPFTRFLGGNRGEPPMGAGYARNRGAEKARGKYLLFLDADDWLEPEALERMLAVCKTHNAIAYTDYSGYAFIEGQYALKLQQDRRLLQYNEKTSEAQIAYRAFDYDCALAQRQPELNAQGEYYLWCNISSLLPKAWHNEVGGFDESMASWEDYGYWIALARKGKCFVRVPERLLNYRFYTGTRRELATPSTESSRQLAKSLVQYLHEKFAGEKVMGCASCGKASVPVMEYPQMIASPQMATSETVEVELVDGNFGDHSITGVATKTFYGYRKHGETFLMNRGDAEMQPRSFRILEAMVIDDTPQMDVFSEPLPAPSFDFTTLPDVTQEQANKLAEMGIRTLGGFSMADQEMLKDIFGARQLKRVLAAVNDMDSSELDRKEVDMTR